MRTRRGGQIHRLAAAILALACGAIGCDDPAPPPRATYLGVWSDALESVIREQALVGGSERLAAPSPADHNALTLAVDAARAAYGVDGAAWERAVLAHERDARDEIHVRTSDLVHGWAQVSRNPVGTLGRVVGETTEMALTAGWTPSQRLAEAAVAASFRVSYVPDVDDPRPPGLRQIIAAQLPLDSAANRAALAADLEAFRATAAGFIDQVLGALPPERLRQTLSDQRLTDGMWEHAQGRWREGPGLPVEDAAGPFDAGYAMLTELDERVAKVEQVARLIDAWWAAGLPDAEALFVDSVRTEARQMLGDQVEAAANGTDSGPSADPELPARVLAESRARLEAQARAEVPLRMLLLRRGHDDAGPALDAVAAEVAAARAVAALDSATVVRAVVDHARSVAPPEQIEPFLLRWELANLALAAARETLRAAAGVDATFLDYVDRRLDAEPGAKAALDEAIDARLEGR